MIRNLTRSPAGEFLEAAGLLDRNEYPRLLEEWLASGELPPEYLSDVIGTVWQMPEWPVAQLGQDRWLELWHQAGFVGQTEDAPPPTELVTVYRGTTWGRRRGMSWTTDLDRATWFASRISSWLKVEGIVVGLAAPPQAVLADLASEDRQENEVVVDPNRLPPITRSDIVWSSADTRS